jgi:hypothetical protein
MQLNVFVVDRFEWRNMIFDTISIGTPERDAKVAEWRRKSWGRK